MERNAANDFRGVRATQWMRLFMQHRLVTH